ncbi:MAG TPA: hypothetical protein DCZ95_12455 [Verrucomicrobia bacterium]|nr:hypothetical protein [Verrucomicrobiota bacterium]
MQMITISISDTTYNYIKAQAQTSVECRAGAMLDLSVEAQQEIEKYREDQGQGRPGEGTC